MSLSSSLNSHYEKFLATGEVKCIDEEIPFEIPDGWEWTRLGNVAELIGGYAFKSESLKGSSGTRVIRISDISESGFVNKNIVRYCGAGVSNSFRVQNGDILIAMTGGTVGKSMCITKVPEALLLNQRVAAIRCRYLNTDYLDIVIKSPMVQDVVTDKKNSTNDNISMGDIYNFLIPVPPYQQQFRIILQYQKLVPFFLRYKSSQEALDQLNNNISALLKKAILQDAIQGKLVPQDPSDEPASELLKRIREEKQKLVKEGKLKKKDITDSFIFKGDDNRHYEKIGSEMDEIDIELAFPKSWQIVRLGDICRLIDGEKKSGSYPCLDAKFLRGKTTAAMLNVGKYVGIGSNIILVDGENSGEVFSVPMEGYMGSTFKQLWISSEMYVPYVLNFIRYYKDQLRNSKKGAAIPHLNKDIFYNLVIGIPPFDEQKRIVGRSHQLMKLLE